MPGPYVPREGYATREERTQQVRMLVEKGYSTRQIGRQIGISPSRVCVLLRMAGLKTQPREMKETYDAARIIDQTDISLDSIAASLRTIPVDVNQLSPEKAQDVAVSIASSVREFNKLVLRLKERANAKDHSQDQG